MFWFVNIAVLLFSYFASQAISQIIRARQKPPLPGGFDSPTIASGTSWPKVYGTRRVRPIPVWALPAKLVQVNLDSHTLFGLFPTTTVQGYNFKFTGLLILCEGYVSYVRNMIFGDQNKSLADQSLTQTAQAKLPDVTINFSGP